jgi:hypothetical protein
MVVAAPASDPVLFAADAVEGFELPMPPSTRLCITIYEAADGLGKAVLAVAAEAAESLAADFVECLNPQQRRAVPLHIF